MSKDSAIQRHSGSCHCGEVRFEVTGPFDELTTCDCSLCAKKNALMAKVHECGFRMLSGEENLGKYQWNTMVAEHYFCKNCGIYTFHKKRSEPDHYGFNVYALDNFDPSNIPVRRAKGSTMTLECDAPQETWIG